MKKIVFLSLFALCLPWALSAQSVDDDLYYVPSKKKEEKTEKKKTPAADAVVVKTNAPTTVYASPGNTTIVVKDRKGNIRDVDEYNRRYDSKDYDFSQENDTLYIDEKEDDGLDGEWVNGFDGSEDDYEYATRIIRFRNPRYAISISSPLYWDVVYGLNPWDWNVYTDGLYAYAFPTFTNRLWWDWRYNSFGWGGYPYYGWGWNSWYGPGWGFGWSVNSFGLGGYPYYGLGWNSWYGPGWGFGWSVSWGGWYGGGWWGHHHYHHHCYPGGGYWPRNTYTYRRSSGASSYRNSSSTVRRTGSAARSGVSSYRRDGQSGTTTRRVVGTRPSGTRSGVTTRTDAASTRRRVYTRPSSTRVGSSASGVQGSSSRVPATGVYGCKTFCSRKSFHLQQGQFCIVNTQLFNR